MSFPFAVVPGFARVLADSAALSGPGQPARLAEARVAHLAVGVRARASPSGRRRSCGWSRRCGTGFTQAFAELVGPDNEFYMNYFQEPGRVEGEAEADVRRWLEGFYYGASADAPSGHDAGMWIIPKGDRIVDRLPRLDTPLAWLPKEDLDVYAGEFERTGLRGGLNRHRNRDLDSDDLAALRGQPLRVPALFIGGDKDGPTVWGASAIAWIPRDAAVSQRLPHPRELKTAICL